MQFYDLIERLMSEADSPLRRSLEEVCRIVRSESGMICLRGYKTEKTDCIAFDGRGVHGAAPREDLLLSEAARVACEKGETVQSGVVRSFVLSDDETGPFGGIAFLRGSADDEDELRRAVAAFSEKLREELLKAYLDSDAPEILRGEDLCMNYFGGTQPNTVDNVSFSIRGGQFTIIMGRSGSGKSTLLNMIGGMLTPTGGKLW